MKYINPLNLKVDLKLLVENKFLIAMIERKNLFKIVTIKFCLY